MTAAMQDADNLDLHECHAFLLRCLQQRDGDGAKRWLARITGRWPELTGKYCGLIASTLAAQGQLEPAVRLYQDAVEFDPADTLARYYLGVALQKLGQTDTAKEHWAWIAEHYPERPEAFFQNALVAITKGDTAAAERIAKEAVTCLPADHALQRDAALLLNLIELDRRRRPVAQAAAR